MDKTNLLVFDSKEKEIQHLVEFKDIFYKYVADVNKMNKNIDERKEKINSYEDSVDYYSNPTRYYGNYRDGFDSLRSFCKFLIYLVSFSMVITFLAFLGVSGAVAGGNTSLLPTALIMVFAQCAENFILSLAIFIVAFFSKKFRIARKFKREKDKRNKNIAFLNDSISKTKKEIDQFDLIINDLDTEFGKVKTILAPSDYEYVEYIIYLYVTNRADNLKEALILLDEEKRRVELVTRMNELEYAIEEAASYISSRVSGAINTMSSKISRELEASRNQMNRQMSAMNAQMAFANTVSLSQLSQLSQIRRNTSSIDNSLSNGIKVY